MPDARDDGRLERANRPGKPFVVVGLQIFVGAAAAHEQNDVAACPVEKVERPHERSCCARPLHGRFGKNNLHPGHAPRERTAHLPQGGPPHPPRKADALRECRERALFRRIKKPLCLELCLEREKCRPKRAAPGAPPRMDHQLKPPVRRIDLQLAAHLNAVAFGRHPRTEVRAPDDAGKDALLILEREIHMLGTRARRLRDFARNPAIGQKAANGLIEPREHFGNGHGPIVFELFRRGPKRKRSLERALGSGALPPKRRTGGSIVRAASRAARRRRRFGRRGRHAALISLKKAVRLVPRPRSV